MKLYPALDLYQGECVQLKKGDFDAKKTYFSDPLKTVQWLIKQGATYLHLVDLSGAKDPAHKQTEWIRKISKNTTLAIQCGGGIRTFSDIQILLETGVQRVVLGSIAIQNPSLTKEFIQEFGANRITLALDVLSHMNEVKVALQGWKQFSDQSLLAWIEHYQKLGIQNLLCTEISCDGMLSGPHFALYRSLLTTFPDLKLQASGGIANLADLTLLSQIGVDAAILGTALYEGRILLPEALLQSQMTAEATHAS